MKNLKVRSIIRIVFGTLLTVFGLNGMLGFIPLPPLAAEAQELMGAFLKAGYIMPIVGVLEVSVGILVLINRFTAFALVVIFPILLNAFLFHLFLDVAGIGGSLVMIILNIVLFFLYKEKYNGIFEIKNR